MSQLFTNLAETGAATSQPQITIHNIPHNLLFLPIIKKIWKFQCLGSKQRKKKGNVWIRVAEVVQKNYISRSDTEKMYRNKVLKCSN